MEEQQQQQALRGPSDAIDGLLQLTIPDQTFTVVEYPGVVRNVQRALHAMGGEASVPAAAASAKHLRLSLRPSQPQAHPLFAYAKPCRSILLRVSRKHPAPGTAPSEEAEQQPDKPASPNVQVVGVVRTSLQFRGLADYQYLTSTTQTAAAASSAAPAAPATNANSPAAAAVLPPECLPAQAEPSGVAQPLLCLPILFSKLDAPLLDFAWRQAQSSVLASHQQQQQHGAKAGKAGAGSTRQRAARAEVVSYHVDAVPAPTAPEHPPAPHVSGASGANGVATPAIQQQQQQQQEEEEQEEGQAVEAPARTPGSICLHRMAQLLVQRPVWPAAVLREQLLAPAAAAGVAGVAGGVGGAARGARVQQQQQGEQEEKWQRPEHVDEALSQLTYRFKSGPWRGLCIRRGYDPRHEVDRLAAPSRALHLASAMVRARVVQQRAARPSQRHTPHTRQHQQVPGRTTTRTTVLQLCDIQPHAPQTLQAACAACQARASLTSISTSAPHRAPDDTTGWFTADEWQSIEHAVAAAFDALIADSQKQPVDPRLQPALLAAAPAPLVPAAVVAPATQVMSQEGGVGEGGEGPRRSRGARGRGGRGRGGRSARATEAAGDSQVQLQPLVEEGAGGAGTAAMEGVEQVAEAAPAHVQQQPAQHAPQAAGPVPHISRLLHGITLQGGQHQQGVPPAPAFPPPAFQGLAGPYLSGAGGFDLDDDDDVDAYELFDSVTNAVGAGGAAGAALPAATGHQPMQPLGADLPGTVVRALQQQQHVGVQREQVEHEQDEEAARVAAAGAEEEDEYAYLNEDEEADA